MKYQIGVCDDELYQVKVNVLFLKEIAAKNGIDIECHGFNNGAQLKKYLAHKHLDVLLMDIDLNEESGIELAEEIAKEYPNLVLIFVTGHREFMKEAFEVEARGYLVKPLELDKMESVLKKALLQASALSKMHEAKELVVTDENIKKKIAYKDICSVQRQQYKCVIVTYDQEYSVYESLSAIYLRLGDDFLRVNRSEIVNTKLVLEVSRNRIKLKNNREVLIGRTFQKEVHERFCTN